jgi:hypothetical protein
MRVPVARNNQLVASPIVTPGLVAMIESNIIASLRALLYLILGPSLLLLGSAAANLGSCVQALWASGWMDVIAASDSEHNEDQEPDRASPIANEVDAEDKFGGFLRVF